MGKSIQKLTSFISEFPGVGPRQARRIVQFLLEKNPAHRNAVSESIRELSRVFECSSCFRFFEGTQKGLCALCADPARESTLMVVAKDVDIEGVENSGAYHGKYFVLGGLIPMARQRKNDTGVRIKEFLSRLQKNGTKEVILALATTPEGDYTSAELMKELREKMPALTVTLLGRGLSVGAEIEYADQETLRNALKNRS